MSLDGTSVPLPLFLISACCALFLGDGDLDGSFFSSLPSAWTTCWWDVDLPNIYYAVETVLVQSIVGIIYVYGTFM